MRVHEITELIARHQRNLLPKKTPAACDEGLFIFAWERLVLTKIISRRPHRTTPSFSK